MDEVIGFAVVGIIIAGLIYTLIKQIIETKHSRNNSVGPLYRKQMARKNRVMTVGLIGVIVFYTLNIVSAIASSSPISNTFTGLGTLVSFIVYLYANFAMKPQLGNQRRNLSLYQ